MAESNVAERLKSFIESKGLSYSQFADKCGIPRPSLSQLLTGRNKKINDSMVGQIHREFPELSIVWLLFGEGEMENLPSPVDAVSNFSDNNDPFNSLFPDLPLTDENFVRQNLENLPNGTSASKNSKEIGLNTPQKEAENIGIKDSRLSKKIKDLTSKIEDLKRNPRKVIQITVYYDDSTFETFLPSVNAIRN